MTIETQLERAAAACAREGGQLTPLRRAVLALVLEAGRPVTAYQLLDQLKATRAGAMPPTVYRALDFLITHHLVHKIEQLNAFVACIDPGHHAHAVQFLICHRCGTVQELDNHSISHAIDDAARAIGFHPASVVVEVNGTCAQCAK